MRPIVRTVCRGPRPTSRIGGQNLRDQGSLLPGEQVTQKGSLHSSCSVPKIWNIYSQKLNCADLFRSTFMYLGTIYIQFQQSVLFGISIFQYWVRELNRRSGQKGRELPRSSGLSSSCPPFRSCSWAESLHKWTTYKFPISKITDHK
jgi:hypothetical protein